MKKIVSVLFVLIIGFNGFGQKDSILLKTHDLIESKKFSEAKELLDQFIKVDTTNAEAYLQRSKCNPKSSIRARNDALHALSLDSTNAAIYIELGKSYALPGFSRHHLALKAFNKAISLDSNSYRAYNGRGAYYFYFSKNITLALADLNKSIELKPNYQAFFNIGLVYKQEEDYFEAIKNFTSSIELNNDFIDAFVHRGLCYLNNAEYSKAIKDYTYYIEIYDSLGSDNKHNIIKYYRTLNSRAICYYMNEEYQKAIIDLTYIHENYRRQLINYFSTNDILFCRTRCYHKLMEYEKAIDGYTEVIKNVTKPNNGYKTKLPAKLSELYLFRANCFEEIGELKSAKIDRKNSENPAKPKDPFKIKKI